MSFKIRFTRYDLLARRYPITPDLRLLREMKISCYIATYFFLFSKSGCHSERNRHVIQSSKIKIVCVDTRTICAPMLSAGKS